LDFFDEDALTSYRVQGGVGANVASGFDLDQLHL
jgi:hypothetical protein